MPRGIWRRNLHVLVAAQVLAVAAMSIVLPFIPFFVRELGVTDRAEVERWSGLIFSGPFFAAALMSPVWGFVGDRYGHKRVVIRAVAGLAIVNFVLVFVQSPLQFWVVRLIQGTVTGFIPAALAITSASTPPEHLPGAIGRLHASASAGRLVGPAIGGVLAGFLAFREIFVVAGTVISVALVLVAFFLHDTGRTEPKERTPVSANLRHVARDPVTRSGLAGLLVVMAGISMVMPIFPLYVEDLLGGAGDATFWTGIGFAVVAATTLVAASFLGRVAEAIGLKFVLLGSLVLGAGAMFLHPVARTVPAMLAVRALLGIGAAGVTPTLYTMISRQAPQGTRGGIAGFASSATIFGFFLGPLLGGWLAGEVGVSGVFRLAGGLLLACGAAAALIAKRVGRDRTLHPLPEQTPR